MRFAFIARHRGVWQTRRLCQALGVSRGGFYEWMSRPESTRAQRNRELTQQIRTSFEQEGASLRSLLEHIVLSEPFRNRRGQEAAP